MLRLPKSQASYWRQTYSKESYPDLRDDMEVDVVIVGGGITGLTAAYLLKQAGKRVAVLEKRTVGAGTTGRTTGKVTSQHNLIYTELARKHGEKAAKIYGEANQAAVEEIARLIEREAIDCDFSRQDSFVYTADARQIAELKQEAELAARLGLPASFVTDTSLPFRIKGAVRFANQGKFHAQKYVFGLARAVDGDGSHVFENSRVIDIHDGEPAWVRTSEGKVIAKQVVVATSVPTLPLMARGSYCFWEYPTESYIVAGRLQKSFDGMYISPDEQHYSILPVDADGGKLLLIGGESNLPGFAGSKDKRYQKLADYAERYFGVEEIIYKWCDRDYLSYDKIPLIGKAYPWSDHLYVATAFMKWGLSSSMVAGTILRDIILGQPNPWASVFDSTRLKPLRYMPGTMAKLLSGKAF
jgi:glycine/D-amino acid oxidase-like deaminating enzyme